MSDIPAVLNAAADEIERWGEHKTRYELKPGAGGAVFTVLFETAKRLYGWTAIQHLQKHLGAELGSGQLQHWRETDQSAVVKALREAAQAPTAPDVEAETLRVQLADFHAALAEAMGWLGYDVTTLVREVGSEMARLRKDKERLERELAEERKRRRVQVGEPR